MRYREYSFSFESFVKANSIYKGASEGNVASLEQEPNHAAEEFAPKCPNWLAESCLKTVVSEVENRIAAMDFRFLFRHFGYGEWYNYGWII